ncbi:MAG TPA: arylsulfatase, partial [Myxococcaceae bacterium]
FFYFSDDAELVAVRAGNMKFVFCEQRVEGTAKIWTEPFVCLRVPKMFNLRMDPSERADITSNTYYEWMLRHAFYVVPVQAKVGEFLGTFKQYPPRQRPSSFSVDQLMERFQKATSGKGD